MHMVKHNKNKWIKIADGGRHTELKKEIGVAEVGENVTEKRGNLEKKQASAYAILNEKNICQRNMFFAGRLFSLAQSIFSL